MNQNSYSPAALGHEQHQPQHSISIPRGGAAGVELFECTKGFRNHLPRTGDAQPCTE